MAIQFGTVDGLVNISEQTILLFVKAINEFILQGGPTYAKSKGLAYGTAFQRFVDPVYNDNTAPFDLQSILTPVYTKSGKEQSPARITFCKKMGLLEIDEPKDIFKLTPLGHEILNNEITIEEYAFILLTKMGVLKDGVYCDNVFYIISSYFQTNSKISPSLFEQYIKNKYNDTDLPKTRIDIILNAIATSGLISKVTNDLYVLSNTEYALIFSDFYKHKTNLNPGLRDTDNNYSNYIGSFENGIFDVLSNENVSIYNKFYPNLKKYMKGKKEHTLSNGLFDQPLQQIFYGAPGTGKSHKIKDDANVKAADEKNLVFRTTFHPDSDYSTFVGCYKPTKAISKRLQRMNLSLEDLAKELGSYYSNEELGKIGGIQKFCFEYYPYLDGEYMSVNVTKLLELAGVPKDYNVEINKYIKFCHLLPKQDPDKIMYAFVPQAFTNAYMKAWNTDENVYLIIEEINRGNCAQIFGDLFQLLDRKNGVSEYPVEADTDLQNYLQKALVDTTRTDIPEEVKSGKKLMLPSNLYIWATMNTSDQSLFPIDSAFKRRWEWKYIKIKEGKDENGDKLNWNVDVKMDDSGTLLSWWDFIKKINEIIASMTSSADKQLGYFFCCAKDGVIDEETFVSKVIFYLWNDVFKDYGFEDASLFRYTTKDEDGKDMEKDLTFPDFYDEEGEKVNTERLTDFVNRVMSWKVDNKKGED